MKNWLVLSLALLLVACGSSYQVPTDITDSAIKNEYQVIYSPQAGVWNNGGMADDRIVFTKHISSGSGSYSEYSSGDIDFSPNSTYEFLYNGRLIGYNQHDLYFTEVVYEQGKFVTRKLSFEQVQELFPGLEIVKISQAKDGVIMVKKPVLGEKSFLLLNDTDDSFYRYSFAGAEAGKPIKSLLTVDNVGEIVFSHYGADDAIFPALKIKVERGL